MSSQISKCIIFEPNELSITLSTIWYHALPPLTVSARRSETVLVWAWQDVVNGQTKFRVLARCENSIGPIKYRINTRFLSKYDVNVNRYWDNIVPLTSVCWETISQPDPQHILIVLRLCTCLLAEAISLISRSFSIISHFSPHLSNLTHFFNPMCLIAFWYSPHFWSDWLKKSSWLLN